MMFKRREPENLDNLVEKVWTLINNKKDTLTNLNNLLYSENIYTIKFYHIDSVDFWISDILLNIERRYLTSNNFSEYKYAVRKEIKKAIKGKESMPDWTKFNFSLGKTEYGKFMEIFKKTNKKEKDLVKMYSTLFYASNRETKFFNDFLNKYNQYYTKKKEIVKLFLYVLLNYNESITAMYIRYKNTGEVPKEYLSCIEKEIEDLLSNYGKVSDDDKSVILNITEEEIDKLMKKDTRNYLTNRKKLLK